MPKTRLLLSTFAIILTALVAAPSVVLNHPTGDRGLFMVDKLGAHLRFFDPVTFKELASIETPPNPHDFTLSADHSLAYVPIYGDGVYGRNPHPAHEIEIVDLAARKMIGTIDVAPYRAPHGIQIDSKGLLYVTCDLDRKLLVVDPKKRSVLDAIDTDGTGHWDALLADGSKVYVTNKTDRPFISVIDTRTRKMIGRVPAPGGSEGIAASPDGKTVVAMDHTDPLLIVIDPKIDQVLDRIPLRDNTKGAYKLYFSPDGKRLLTMNMTEKSVNVFDASNLRGDQRVLPVGKDPMGIAFSPDGKTALVANHGDGSVSVIDLEKMQVAKSFHAGTGIETLAYY